MYWESFLPIRAASLSDAAEVVSSDWLVSHGFDKDAITVLRAIRESVLPVIRKLQKESDIWFAFPLHDYKSGVPTEPTDLGAYVHLQVKMIDGVDLVLPKEWIWTRRAKNPDSMSGINLKQVNGGIDRLVTLWCIQYNWYLDIIEMTDCGDDLEQLKSIRQMLHFFANIAQTVVT